METSKLSNYLTTNAKTTIAVVAFAWFGIRLATAPVVPSDGHIWLPLGEDFVGNLGQSDGLHRPLYALMAHIIFLVIELFEYIGIPLERILDILGARSNAELAWLALNLISAVGAGLFAYFTAQVLNLGDGISLTFSLLTACSTELFAWSNHTLINNASVMGIFFAWHLLARLYVKLRDVHSVHNIALTFLMLGVLMLGKAEYFLIGFGILWLLILTRSVYLALVASLASIAPLSTYIFVLWIFGIRYRNYEIDRFDYSLLGWWKGTITDRGFVGFLEEMLVSPISSGMVVLYIGIGVLPTFCMLGFIFQNIRRLVGLAALTYVLSAIWFLKAVNFWMARHAYEVAPVAYLSVALFLSSLWRNSLFAQRDTFGNYAGAPDGKKLSWLVVQRCLTVVLLFSVIASNAFRADLQI